MIEESGCTISQSQVSVTNSEQQISHLDCDDQRVPDSVLDIEIEDEGKDNFGLILYPTCPVPVGERRELLCHI